MLRGKITPNTICLSNNNIVFPSILDSSNGEKITWPGKEETSTSSPSPIVVAPMSPVHDESDTFIEMAYSSPERTVTKSAVGGSGGGGGGVKRKANVYSFDSPTVPSNNTDADDAFREALHCFKKLCKSREERQENEALHGFGQMIIATIGGMSASKQTKAMMRVTELVMRIRMEDDE